MCQATSVFSLRAYRLRFIAETDTTFPSFAGNVIRGALGDALLQLENNAAAISTFRPGAQAPSGFRNPPPPFVIRAFRLDRAAIRAGEEFSFDLHCFGSAVLDTFMPAFLSWQTCGITKNRTLVKLTSVDSIGRSRQTTVLREPIAIDLRIERDAKRVTRLCVRFVTPTELKHGSEIVERPGFPVLFARLRDRIAALAQFYGHALEESLSLPELTARAAAISLGESNLCRVSIERRSSRTGQTHPLGGFVGTAVYEGNLTAFLPWLEAGYWAGIGRQTVWGKGAIETVAE